MSAPALTGASPADDDAVVRSSCGGSIVRLTVIGIRPLRAGAVFLCATLPLVTTAAGAAEFCERVRSLRGQTCLARYDCTVQPNALMRLRNAACACMRNVRPAPAENVELMTLAERTRSFACCYGIAIAGMPDVACRAAAN